MQRGDKQRKSTIGSMDLEMRMERDVEASTATLIRIQESRG